MKAIKANSLNKDIFELLPQAIIAVKKTMFESVLDENMKTKYINERPPLRSELFTEEHLKQHAKDISRKHILISGSPAELLLKRLAENEKILLEVHALLAKVVNKNESIVTAAEWLLDNFYLIEEHIYIGKKHLPKGYSKELPQLAKGASSGLPRVYDIAVEIISHSDGHIDPTNLTGFIHAYQTITSLKIGELWAIPIMLRLALIENLRRLSIQIAIDINNKTLANYWADKLIEQAENDSKNLVLVIADMSRSELSMESSFVAELTRRLQEKGNILSLPINWIEQQLSSHGLNSKEVIQKANQKQAADQVSISNSISSLRYLGITDWREFVEEVSHIEQLLRQDAVYSGMDLYTRDHYRHAVEKIAKDSGSSEEEVAIIAIEAAKESTAANNNARLGHVGYYLIGKGLQQLERQAKIKPSFRERCRKITSRFPGLLYMVSIFILTACCSWALINEAFSEGLRHSKLVLVALVCVLSASHLVINFVNWLVTLLSRPSILPKMDFSKGIPDEYRTMVVIPTLLNTLSGINALVENLEIHFLSNRDKNLCFALLTDFKDATSEHLPGDNNLLQAVQHKIIELNKKYEASDNNIFFLFHRPRKWNGREKLWMGYERKRGKLGEINELILGGPDHGFSVIVGAKNIYTRVKFIISLDTDTDLPRDAAWKMAGTLAHPLNKAVYSQKKHRITEGYTILQPRVSNSLPADKSSIYAKIHGNEPGTDPYTRTVSDVYQDIFGEGSFIGKGIYDVASFEMVLKNKFRENRILSHDLLEGCYARCGLITDVQLFEEYPEQYLADMQRRHRWVRGDWQILNWILPFVKDLNKKNYKNPLSFLSLWKICDNLRRSLVPIAFLSMLLFGWIISDSPWFWTMAVLLMTGLPSLIDYTWAVFKKPAGELFYQHLSFLIKNMYGRLVQLFLQLATLPFEAYLNLDAIIRTLWRLLISKRNLLQWNPYGNQQKQKSIWQSYVTMWFAPFAALTTFVMLIAYAPVSLFSAIPFLVLWILVPFITWFISRPTVNKQLDVSAIQTAYLRKLARRTWAFFETFVTQEDNWLPPDNYQEHPVERIAHRTSPTNIGMALLSNLAAYDFGYLTVQQLTQRTSNTLQTMQRMEKYHGHLYNWYDTQTLAPLSPKYVSTVDSGNLAGHLITLRQGLLMLADYKICDERFFNGFFDVLDIMIEKTDSVNAKDLLIKYAQEFMRDHPAVFNNLINTKKYIDKIHLSFAALLLQLNFNTTSEEYWWAQKGMLQIIAVKDELAALCPWIVLPPAPLKFDGIIPAFPTIPTLKQLAGIEELVLHKIMNFDTPDNTGEEEDWLNNFRSVITVAGRRAKEIIITGEQLAHTCNGLANNEYDFLYFRSQHLLTIGYNVDEHKKDMGFYDLLASEARLTTFTAIAQGKLPQDSWFALGRKLTNFGNDPVLLSWSGSMFEYLMPLLVMPAYENTLLSKTYKTIIQKQIEYGKKRGVPWGISESGYNMVDANLNYQYKAFGVPGTGFKRGLGEDLVIAPYATVMALMVEPDLAYANLQVLKKAGFEGRYGFFEAVDYTTSRLQRKQPYVIIKSFMAHHQGMALLSLAYLLLDKPMQKRFTADVQVKSALLLLQERIPRITSFYSPDVHAKDSSIFSGNSMSMSVINTPHTPIPEVQLISNGRYHVMVTNAGGGYSHWKNIALTRWREDITCDNWGSFCFIRDVDIDVYWSTAYQPTLQQPVNYEAVFSQGRAEFRRTDFSMETHTEIVVSPEDDIELRRVHLTNRSRKKRTIEITSYAEIVLAPPLAEEMHPAFNNLFIETAIDEERHAITCTRRARSNEEQVPFMFHLMKVNDAVIKDISYETDRNEFIGRGYSINNPKVMCNEFPLTGRNGAVLDPVVAIRYLINIEPHASATIDIIMGIAETKEQCNTLIDKYQDLNLTNRVLELAWTHGQVILRQINASEPDAQLYARLASSILFANDSLRTDAAIIIKNQRGQSGLWGYTISGDLPIVLLQVGDSSNIELVKQLIQAHAFWRMKGLVVDLVIWNEDNSVYRQVLQNQILSLLIPWATDNKNQPGGIFIRSSHQITNEDRILFQTVARVVISDKLGTLEEQINKQNKLKTALPYFSPLKFHTSNYSTVAIPTGLKFFNGIGGFSADGKEYVIITTAKKTTPVPWSNILANRFFGSVITESGQSYTWLNNAHELRLTPWNNDPILDFKGEAFYLRDEESGKFWSPSPLPCRGSTPYVTRHGFGYSVFEHSEDGIDSSLTVYADITAPIKFMVLKLHNRSGRTRRLSATGYVEWILGDIKSKTQMHVTTEFDSRSGAVLARNSYNTEFQDHVAFFNVDDVNQTITTDRTEFIGRNGTLHNPDGLNRSRLSGRSGAGLDSCAVIQVPFVMAEEQDKQIIFKLGAGYNSADTLAIIKQFEGTEAAMQALERVRRYWQRTLSVVQVETPDDTINILSNGWLNYQTIACRLWAKSGFYQSGGAFGFRDQLQDVLSIMHTRPEMAREQLILCASRQFKEGDVQHWWHPPLGRGVRTTCSDDYLWLPYVTYKYIIVTGDIKILDEPVHFLEGRLLNEEEESYYDMPIKSDKQASFYEHCVTAIDKALLLGMHGLPFIGSGDWNDGMDKVGYKGKGESIWLAFFLYDILIKFTEVAALKNDNAFIKKCTDTAAQLKKNIDNNAWDGEWYRRAYFDDGSPLGSAKNTECKIDSIAQSWSVLSGAGAADKQITAMNSAETYLVKKQDRIIQLFDPPFDKSVTNPGYIKGYVPGVRENGGQYTHGAIWLIMAFAKLGDTNRTWELIQLINPVNNGKDAETIARYKGEPYVIAADVYAQPLHKGKAGWTWYTGSAGWMYQLLIESFIGLQKKGNRLYFSPCLPAEWPLVKIKYSYMDALYAIEIVLTKKESNQKIVIDGIEIPENFIQLENNKAMYTVSIIIGTTPNHLQ